MKLDEAIRHANDVSECTIGECKNQHEQLAEWLLELKAYRNTNLTPDEVQKLSDASEKVTKELCEKMKECATATSDIERAHVRADDILCEAVKLFGCTELVELFAQVDKWYA